MTEVTQGMDVIESGIKIFLISLFSISAIVMIGMLIAGKWIDSLAEKWKFILLALIGSVLLALLTPSLVDLFSSALNSI